ncbi:conserved hypothetical protein [Xenorhabdus bovienii str. oregonense]|uniref:Phage tail assembly protein n=1 Tax=Xenorhabdus bovienii str. oregonense TaxID=1398202 RepID=A0A077P8S4_XENBV|nr:hypothetical protein [Xenorhabdus bovienii]CDH07224.1 conserved hypothetical protein [Xenorhabdus bovienii str. oregonense]
MITHTGKLLYGVEYGDGLHYDFRIKLSTMRQSYEALDETESVCGSVEGHKADLHYRMAVLTKCLVNLGTIPAEDITTELLLDQLTGDDFDLLEQAIADIKKKRLRLPSDAAGSCTSVLPSGNTASVMNASSP